MTPYETFVLNKTKSHYDILIITNELLEDALYTDKLLPSRRLNYIVTNCKNKLCSSN